MLNCKQRTSKKQNPSIRLYSTGNWKMPSGAYTMISVGEGTGGGMMRNPAPGASSAWLPYVLVDDIVAATEKAKSLGATVITDVMEVMGAGWLSIFADPTGATLGLWKPKRPEA
jgi:uncharacterized protein